jgi:hypothetical protein
MKKTRGTRLMLLGAGILLVVLGLRGVALGVAGKSIQAEVTAVDQAIGQQEESLDHNYQISYRFSVDGKAYTGSYTRKKVYNAATLPSVGAQVAVRYLPAVPAVNGGPDTGSVGGIIMGALGLVLLFLGIKPPKPAAPAVQTESAAVPQA